VTAAHGADSVDSAISATEN